MKLALVGLVLILAAQTTFSSTLLQTKKSAMKAAKQSAQTGDTASGEDNDYTDSLAGLTRQLNEANRSFTYRGKPINPRALMELIETFSDGAVGPVAIDLSGTYESDRYYGEFQTKRDGSVFIDLKTADPSFNEGDEDPCNITYKRLGTLKGNLHVIEIQDTTRLRRGFTTELLLIRFNIDYEYKEDGSRRHRLVMQRLGTIFLGDGFTGQVKVQPHNNSIRIIGDSALTRESCCGRKPVPEKIIVIK